MPNKSNRLPSDPRGALIALIAATSLEQVSRELNIHRETILRIVANVPGVGVREGTLEVVRGRLAALCHAGRPQA